MAYVARTAPLNGFSRENYCALSNFVPALRTLASMMCGGIVDRCQDGASINGLLLLAWDLIIPDTYLSSPITKLGTSRMQGGLRVSPAKVRHAHNQNQARECIDAVFTGTQASIVLSFLTETIRQGDATGSLSRSASSGATGSSIRCVKVTKNRAVHRLLRSKHLSLFHYEVHPLFSAGQISGIVDCTPAGAPCSFPRYRAVCRSCSRSTP